jgi:hypothetical protein
MFCTATFDKQVGGIPSFIEILFSYCIKENSQIAVFSFMPIAFRYALLIFFGQKVCKSGPEEKMFFAFAKLRFSCTALLPSWWCRRMIAWRVSRDSRILRLRVDVPDKPTKMRRSCHCAVAASMRLTSASSTVALLRPIGQGWRNGRARGARGSGNRSRLRLRELQ